MPSGGQSDIIRASVAVEITAARGKSAQPRVSIIAYTGGVIDVAGYGPLIIDLAGVELPNQVPLLADHENTLGGIIGHGTPAIVKGELTIGGVLVDSEPARRVRDLAAGGVELRASVGVKPLETRPIRKGDVLNVNGRTLTAERAMMLVSRGRLAEVSIVAVGADSDTAVSIAARGGSRMPGTDPNVNNKTNNQNNPPAGEGGDVLATERTRIAGIMRIARDFPDIQARAVEEGWDNQRVELEVLRAARPPAPALVQGGLPSGPPRDILAAAALLHAGELTVAEKSFGETVCARASELRITSSLDLCRAALVMEGQMVPRDRAEMIRAAFSTSALHGALAAATQREAMAAFTEAPSSWRMIAKTRPSPDFRQRLGLRPYLKDGRLDRLGPDGEIKHASPTPETYPFQVHTFARMFSVTRQTIVNDNIGAVFELLRELGLQAARTIADEVAALILANPDDFFSSGNGNFLVGVDTALSIEALGRAVQTLREQKDSDGKPIDVSPKTLLVPPSLEAIGRTVLNSQTVLIDGSEDPTHVPAGNPWRNIADLAVDSRLAGQPKAWYLFANPNNVPAIVVSFLNGLEAPTVESDDTGFDTLGKQFRCYIDFGVDAADPRGAVKAKGEA
jgi:phage major head subunit gpT-like protein